MCEISQLRVLILYFERAGVKAHLNLLPGKPHRARRSAIGESEYTLIASLVASKFRRKEDAGQRWRWEWNEFSKQLANDAIELGVDPYTHMTDSPPRSDEYIPPSPGDWDESPLYLVGVYANMYRANL